MLPGCQVKVARADILQLLNEVRSGDASPEQALEQLANYPYQDLGDAKIDHHRLLRTGMPEVIFAQGKTPAQVGDIFRAMADSGQSVLATRASLQHYEAVARLVPEAIHEVTARAITLRPNLELTGKGTILVVAAGTSDLPVAEEARVTAELLGNRVECLVDVGVAGLHRLLAHLEQLRQARVLIVCAGMEGALPSVVAGLVAAPVIAVATSVGYGASFGGLTALLGMLNSCTPNVCTVNIDNGFGAAYLASMMNHL